MKAARVLPLEELPEMHTDFGVLAETEQTVLSKSARGERTEHVLAETQQTGLSKSVQRGLNKPRLHLKDAARLSQLDTLLTELGVDSATRAKFADEGLTPESIIHFSNEEFRQLGIKAGLRYTILKRAKEVMKEEDYLRVPPTHDDELPENLTPAVSGPKHPELRGGGKSYVDVGFEVLNVNDINTCESKVSVQLQIVYYWTDSRFIGWPTDRALPPDTWGPAVRVKGERSPTEGSDVTFAVYNSHTGRMKRTVLYRLEVDWFLDKNLPDFPFDAHDFTVWFRSASDFSSFDGASAGNSALEHQYLFRAAKQNTGFCGSDFLKVIWDRRHHGWKCHGISTELDYEGIVSSGYEPTNLKLHFHISRKTHFFWFQMIIPLIVTTLLSWGAYLEDIKTGLEARTNGCLTCLLAQFALLYVVQEHLPNLPFLTALDIAVFASVFCTGLAGVTSMFVHWLDRYYDEEDAAERINDNVGRASIVIYFLVLVYNIAPKVWRQNTTVAELLQAGVTDKTKTFCDKNSHEFDVDDGYAATSGTDPKSHLYLASNVAKSLFPGYEKPK